MILVEKAKLNPDPDFILTIQILTYFHHFPGPMYSGQGAATDLPPSTARVCPVMKEAASRILFVFDKKYEKVKVGLIGGLSTCALRFRTFQTSN